MPHNPPTRGLAARLAPYALTIAGGAALHKASFLIWDWAWPLLLSLRDWTFEVLITLGLNQDDAGYFSPYSAYLLLLALYFVGGAVVGATTHSRWRRFAIIFALTLFASPYAASPREVAAAVHLYGWKSMGFGTLFYIFLTAPSVLLGAWLGSRPAKRRRARRRASGLCEACGYSLTGNASGVCPECGLKTDPHPSPPSNKAVINLP